MEANVLEPLILLLCVFSIFRRTGFSTSVLLTSALSLMLMVNTFALPERYVFEMVLVIGLVIYGYLAISAIGSRRL